MTPLAVAPDPLTSSVPPDRRAALVVAVSAAVGALAPILASVLAVAGVAPVVSGVGVIGPSTPAVVVGTVFWAIGTAALVVAARRGRSDVVGAATAGVGALAFGASITDLQLFEGAIDANRLELFRPSTAAALDAGFGAVLVTGGHLLVFVAGVAGAALVRRTSDAPTEDDVPVGRRLPFPVVALLIVATVIVAVAFVLPAYTSTDPVFLAHAVVDGPVLFSIGSAISAALVLILASYALTSNSAPVAAAVMTGVGWAASSTMLVRWWGAAGAGDRIDIGAGPRWGAPAALVLVTAGAVSAWVIGRSATPVGTGGPARPVGSARPASGPGRRHALAGALSIVSAVAVAAPAAVDLLALPGAEAPVVSGIRLTVLIAVITAATSVLLLLSEFAPIARPAVAMILFAQLAAAASVVQALVLAAGIGAVGFGPGAYALLLGIVATVAALAVLVAAGAAERDDIDTSIEREPSASSTAVVVGAAAVAALGVLLPAYSLGGQAVGSIAILPWGYDVWGRVVLAVAVVVAGVVAVRSRPARGASLLLGAAVGPAVLVLGVALVESTEPVSLLVGVYPSGLGAVALVVAAVLVGRTRR